MSAFRSSVTVEDQQARDRARIAAQADPAVNRAGRLRMSKKEKGTHWKSFLRGDLDNAGLPRTQPPIVDLGWMDVPCTHCAALHWGAEKNSKGGYNCCVRGE